MAIKLFLLIIFVSMNAWSQSEVPAELRKENAKLMKAIEDDADIDAEKYSQDLKDWHWNSYKSSGDKILKTDKLNPNLTAQQDSFRDAKEPLEALEYNETEADKLEESVNAHVKYLNDKIYYKHGSLFIDYISWQQEGTLKQATGVKTPVIATNHAACAGGAWGYKSAFYHFFVDGCFMYGMGNVAATKNTVTYKQSDVEAFGGKVSLGAGKVVSSLGSEVGFKVPVFYSHQSLEKPNPGVTVDLDHDLMVLASLYARWHVQKWYVQTEFSKMIGEDTVLWGLGLGHDF